MKKLMLIIDPQYSFLEVGELPVKGATAKMDDLAEFVKTKPYSYLSAVKQGKVIPIESAYIDLQVPRNVDGLVYIHNCIDSIFAEQERYMNQIGL